MKRAERGPSDGVRRSRVIVGCALAFAVVVLATSFPLGALMHQRSTLSSGSASLAQLRAQDKQLQSEAAALKRPATVMAIARQDYGLVPKGVQAYSVLPDAGSADSAGVDTGHVPLDGPIVVPGSSSEDGLLGLGLQAGPAGAGGAGPDLVGPPGSSSGSSRTLTGLQAFWHRVLSALEFWR